jgi:transcriptional antiterminator RfaH
MLTDMNLGGQTIKDANDTGPLAERVAGWYCVRTKPKHEHIAAANLARQAGLDIFCPRLRVQRSTRRGLVRVLEPLFPGYLFVRCVLEEKLDDMRYTNGVGSLVNFGGRIPRVPDEVVETLRAYFADEEILAVADELLPGAEVVVAEGAFEGMRASVLRVLPARQRVQVLLEILGRPTAVEVGRACVTLEQNSLADRVPFMAAA